MELMEQFWSVFSAKLAEKPFTIVGDGEQTRDFTFVTDVCEAMISASKSSISSDIFNVGSGKTISINKIVNCCRAMVYIPKKDQENQILHSPILGK